MTHWGAVAPITNKQTNKEAILKLILKNCGYKTVRWIHLAQDSHVTGHWKLGKKIQDPINGGSFSAVDTSGGLP
jgi:hypothetical protein